MKNYICLFIILSFTINGIMAQNNPYPEGDINLNINETFGQNSDWIDLSTTNEFRHDANYKEAASFTINHDEQIYLINNIKKELQLFNKEGNFIKTLCQISDIAKYHAVVMVGILDNKYIITENYNRLHIFNLDGSLFKIIHLDYPTYQVVSLKENKLAIYAHILLNGPKSKYSIILKDIITEKEKVIESYLTNFKKHTYTLMLDKGTMSCSFPYSKNTYIINCINNNQLLVGYNYNPELKIYNFKGELVSTFNTNIKPLRVEESEKREFKVKIKDRFYKMGYKELYDENPIDEKIFPNELPFFHAIQVDSDNNILIFLYTEGMPKQTAAIYSAYSSNGQFLGTSTFNCADYKLKVHPASKMIRFGHKKIHAIVRDSNELKSPFKLIKLTY